MILSGISVRYLRNYQPHAFMDGLPAHWVAALAIRQKWAPDSLDLSKTLYNLGKSAYEQGELATAEEYDRRALAIEEKQELLGIFDPAARLARSKSSGRRFCPKLIVAGFKNPPHLQTGGRRVWRKDSKCGSGSERCPQLWHSIKLFVPCNSTNRSAEVPARACSPSMFWVTTAITLPARSSCTMASCVGLGRASRNPDHPSSLKSQCSIRAASDRMKAS